MAQFDIEYFKNLILEKREEILEELNDGELKESLKDGPGERSHAFHLADIGSDSNEREKSFMVASIEGGILAQLDEALGRIEEGSYGICAICDEPIHPNRLEAIPYAKLCLECKANEERV
ncbi:MAG: TraR/DksA C4-type zinc finger protein [bacterium]|nr:MAG: TraR/DksA C4-type zinc finger protein [bacterium]